MATVCRESGVRVTPCSERSSECSQPGLHGRQRRCSASGQGPDAFDDRGAADFHFYRPGANFCSVGAKFSSVGAKRSLADDNICQNRAARSVFDGNFYSREPNASSVGAKLTEKTAGISADPPIPRSKRAKIRSDGAKISTNRAKIRTNRTKIRTNGAKVRTNGAKIRTNGAKISSAVPNISFAALKFGAREGAPHNPMPFSNLFLRVLCGGGGPSPSETNLKGY